MLRFLAEVLALPVRVLVLLTSAVRSVDANIALRRVVWKITGDPDDAGPLVRTCYAASTDMGDRCVIEVVSETDDGRVVARVAEDAFIASKSNSVVTELKNSHRDQIKNRSHLRYLDVIAGKTRHDQAAAAQTAIDCGDMPAFVVWRSRYVLAREAILSGDWESASSHIDRVLSYKDDSAFCVLQLAVAVGTQSDIPAAELRLSTGRRNTDARNVAHGYALGGDPKGAMSALMNCSKAFLSSADFPTELEQLAKKAAHRMDRQSE